MHSKVPIKIATVDFSANFFLQLASITKTSYKNFLKKLPRRHHSIFKKLPNANCREPKKCDLKKYFEHQENLQKVIRVTSIQEAPQ